VMYVGPGALVTLYSMFKPFDTMVGLPLLTKSLPRVLKCELSN